jgi:hypothetical protein
MPMRICRGSHATDEKQHLLTLIISFTWETPMHKGRRLTCDGWETTSFDTNNQSPMGDSDARERLTYLTYTPTDHCR